MSQENPTGTQTTTIKSPGKQLGGATLAIGQGVTIKGEHDGRPGAVQISGRVTRIMPGLLDGRLRVTLDIDGGYNVDTVAADEVWINVDPGDGR